MSQTLKTKVTSITLNQDDTLILPRLPLWQIQTTPRTILQKKEKIRASKNKIMDYKKKSVCMNFLFLVAICIMIFNLISRKKFFGPILSSWCYILSWLRVLGWGMEFLFMEFRDTLILLHWASIHLISSRLDFKIQLMSVR
jgi:hypothetical protein